MRRASSVVYLAIDDLVSAGGPTLRGLEDFLASLANAAIPCVWLTNQTRLQLDATRRKLGHAHPFVAEDGCGVYLPEDYFHLKPRSGRTDKEKAIATVRLGRFTCLPIAEEQPAAAEKLERLSSETGISVVSLRSLAPRELAQNTGLQPREAELARQRDFDELFFFAGASDEQIGKFEGVAKEGGVSLRSQGALWSLAIGASTSRCVRALSKLYDRALHAHARTVGVATKASAKELFAACDRSVFLTDGTHRSGQTTEARRGAGKVLEVPLNSRDQWEQLSSYVLERQ